VALGAEDEAQQEHRRQLRQAQRRLSESAERAQARQQAEQTRRQRQQEALQARRQREAKRRQGKKQAAKANAVRHADKGATALKRAQRVSARGLAALSAAWARGECPSPKHLHPEPWPADDQPASTLNEQDFMAHQT
jgi:hypothetical protein